MPVRPCLTSGCKGYAHHGSHCPAHTATRQAWRHQARKAVAEQVQRQPWCAVCGTTLDLTGEHANGRAGDPTDVTETLCRAHNAQRARRGGV